MADVEKVKEFPCPHCGSKKRFHRKDCVMKDKEKETLEYEKECFTCKFYFTNPNLGIHECRRFPPEHVTKWPIVGASDWCGEWVQK